MGGAVANTHCSLLRTTPHTLQFHSKLLAVLLILLQPTKRKVTSSVQVDKVLMVWKNLVRSEVNAGEESGWRLFAITLRTLESQLHLLDHSPDRVSSAVLCLW